MSTAQEETIEGYFYFRARIKVLEKDATKIPLVVIFKGSEAHGKNWSPDCKLLEGTLAELLGAYQLPAESYILKVKVGNSEAWSKEDCPFRLDSKIYLDLLPTVILWTGTSEHAIKRLEGRMECTLENIHNMFLPNAPITAPITQLKSQSSEIGENIESNNENAELETLESENENELLKLND